MKIRPLSGQVTGLASYGAEAQITKKTETDSNFKAKTSEDAAAVKLTKVENAPSQSKDRITQLKEEVAKGTYSPSSQDVARAIARDLL